MAENNQEALSELPLVCICIPTYNAAVTVQETIESILAQTYDNLVIHVSDNASTDETLSIIESIKDSRITIHRFDKNIGGEGNFSRCIQLAVGKYTAIFHADDIYKPDMVAKQVAFLETNPDVGAVFTEANIIDDQGLPLGAIGKAPENGAGVARFLFPELLQKMLLHHNFLVCPSVMVRTRIYQNDIKEWGSSLFKSSSDIDTWLRLATKQPIAILNEKLMYYRISKAQFSESIRNRTEKTDFFLVIDHYLTLPDVLSFITKDDLRHYNWLERHERVARALNLFRLEKISDAKVLLQGIFCWDLIYAALRSRRGLVTLIAGTFLCFLIFSGMTKKGVIIINAAKKISWK
jgi:glycosyltransferase involved in cell wall biosynthesis